MTEATTAPTEVPPERRRWGLGDVAGGWVAVQLFSAIWGITAISLAGRAGEDFEDLPLWLVAIAQLGLALAFVAVPYVVTRTKGRGLVADLGLRARWPDLWRGGLAGTLLQVVAIPLLYWPLLELLDQSPSDLEGPARSLSDRADGVLGVVLLVLIVGVLAPIFEEIFYRGFMQQALVKRGLPPFASIGITALVFGATHFQLLQLPGLVLAGAVFGVLAHRAGRLGPAIAAHVAFNVVTVAALVAA